MEAVPYGGPLLLFVHAYGGWDPVQFCDPKGDLARGFGVDDIAAAGGLNYAPTSWTDTGSGLIYDYSTAFFPEFHRRMIVVQGINMQTNAHGPGTANAFQGTFSSGYPTLAAAMSAVLANSLPLSYLVTGEYRSTGGLLPYTAINRTDVIRSLASPNEGIDLNNGIAPNRMPDEVLRMIDTERSERLDRKLSSETLMPRWRNSALHYKAAARNTAAIRRLGEILPEEGLQTHDEHLYENSLVEQSDIVLHAMAAGLTAAGDVQFPSARFDSHVDHINWQNRVLARLVYGVRFLWRRAEELDQRAGLNISDRLTVVIVSEFGRTPQFNNDGGTNHWPTTSAIIMRKDFETTGIGSRTVGYSTNDGRYQPGRINPVTLEPDESGGIELTSAHLHKALREYLGIADSPVLARFGFPGVESVNMFTPGLATPQT